MCQGHAVRRGRASLIILQCNHTLQPPLWLCAPSIQFLKGCTITGEAEFSGSPRAWVSWFYPSNLPPSHWPGGTLYQCKLAEVQDSSWYSEAAGTTYNSAKLLPGSSPTQLGGAFSFRHKQRHPRQYSEGEAGSSPLIWGPSSWGSQSSALLMIVHVHGSSQNALWHHSKYLPSHSLHHVPLLCAARKLMHLTERSHAGLSVSCVRCYDNQLYLW